MKDTYDLWMSRYDHPEHHRGQHTNGPAKLFVRRPNGRWYRVRIKTHAHAVRRMIAAYGFDHFAATHCDLVVQEPPHVTNDYNGPCLILLDRSTTVDVRRGGRVETVAMPSVDTTHDEPSVK